MKVDEKPRLWGSSEHDHDGATWGEAWKHRRLAMLVAMRCCRGTPANAEDYLVDALRGICLAITLHDPSKGKWSGLAGRCIESAVRRAIARDLMPVRVSSGSLRRARQHLARGTEPRPGTADHDAMAFVIRGFIRAGNFRHRDDDGFDLGSVPDRRATDEARDDRIDAAEIVGRLLRRLKDRERAVIAARFGIGSGTPQTHDRIAAEVGITRQRVQQLEGEILRKLARVLGREATP